MCSLYRDGECIGHHLTSCHDGPLPLEELLDLDSSWNAGRFFYQPEVMFTRDIWQHAGAAVNEDLYFSMDYELWLRFAREGAQLHVIAAPVAWFRQHEEQKTAEAAKFHAELIECRDRYIAEQELEVSFPARVDEPVHRLRVAMLNDVGYDYGAGIAHQRIAQSFLMAGHDVRVVAFKHDEFGLETPSHNLDRVLELVSRHAPHVIITGNLHRTGADPLLLGKLADLAPTFSVMHDFWLITGRCAYSAGCEKYLTGCDHTCPTPDEYPQLVPQQIARAWHRKRDLLASDNPPGLLACSNWTAGFVRRALDASAASLSGVALERVKLGVPAEIFHPIDPSAARGMLGLPQDRFVVLVSGSIGDPRKGIRDVIEAVRILDLPDLLVAVAGAADLDEDFGFASVVHLGYMDTPEKLALAYSAADLFVGASREETFGQAFVEAAACGTPAIGFAVSAVAEAVVPNVTGSLVAEQSPNALAAQILDYYLDPVWRQAVSRWGGIYIRNEWSLHSSYLSFLRVFQKLGLTDKWRLTPKITFQPECPAPPRILNPFGEDTAGVLAHDLSDEENPIPKYDIGRYRWAFGPATRIAYRSAEEGRYTFFLKYRNPHPEQQIKVSCNSEVAFDGPLLCTGYEDARLLIADVRLRAGKNELRLEFTRWNQHGVDPRPLAIIVEQFHLAPAHEKE
jgi:glycosyltransferase involved in cell wall biosynthesis